MSLNQLFRSQTSPTWKRTQLGDFDTVAGDVVRLPRFNGIHDSGGVVAELALTVDLAALMPGLAGRKGLPELSCQVVRRGAAWE